jgi:salicylate hydroxylase
MQPHLVIVGGGIGGPFAANAMVAQGLKVSVYEQAPALGEIGAGVFLTPNSVRQLQRVGFGPQVEKWGALVGPHSQYLRHDGTPIAPVQVTDVDGWNATYGMHRADFVDFLAAALPDGAVHCGHRGVGFEQTADKASVTFANGAAVEADVVIVADGIHSELRPYVFPPSKTVFHNTASYRGLVSRERLPDWPMDRWQMWAGPSKHFLVFPARHGEMVNYVGFVPADAEMKESWSAPGDPDVLRQAFADWDPRTGSILEQVDKTFRWRYTTGRPCQIGRRAG